MFDRILRLPSTWLAVPAVLLFWGLALFSLAGDSPTMDEQNHVARGIAFLRTGDPRLSVEHPPLINIWSALPLLTLPDLQLPLDDPAWDQIDGWYRFADQFLWVVNQDVGRIIFLARLPIVVLTLGLALATAGLARRLWGRPAMLPAFVLTLLDPNILAHGRYSTTDLGGTLFLVLALTLLWQLWLDPGWSWRRLLAAGMGLGLAFGSKLSNLAFVPIFFLLALLPPLVGRRWSWSSVSRALSQLTLAGALSVAVLWVIYGLEWGPLRLSAGAVQPWSWFGDRAVPLPTFWAGLARMVDLGTEAGRPSFLLGQTSVTGFRLYFPIAFLVKTPLLSQLALLLAAIVLLRRPASRSRALWLLLPTLGFFGLMLSNSLNIGYRHLLPLLPLVYCLTSGLTLLAPAAVRQARRPAAMAGHSGGNAADIAAGIGENDSFAAGDLARATARVQPAVSRRLLAGLPWLTCLSLLVIDLWLYPHYLSYFNLAAGGPANGYNILVDSNVDWGQDLLRLQDWMARQQVDSVRLGWFGTARPEYYGLRYQPLPGIPYHLNLFWDPPFNPAQPEPGIYALSASVLWELPRQDKVVFAWFRARAPDDRVGYSIFIYRVEGAP